MISFYFSTPVLAMVCFDFWHRFRLHVGSLRHYFQDCSQLIFERTREHFQWILYEIWVPNVVSLAPALLPYSILSRKVSFWKSLATFGMALGFIWVASGTLFTSFELLWGLDNVILFNVGFCN